MKLTKPTRLRLRRKNHHEKKHTQTAPEKAKIPVAEQPPSGGLQNPFANLEIK